MNGITKRCISIGRGDKDPLKRVNYEFGLVLGVDEFIAEQCYFLEKHYAENRTLHGCGTVSGLHVTVGENGEDIEVRVSPGIGIDQYGRMFIVSREQCASILAWLESQELEAGEHRIFVTAHYNECLTDLVPIAGEPCDNGDDLAGASRIKDITDIELTLEPPPHAAYDAVINLAEFISRLRTDDAVTTSPDIIPRLSEIIGPEVISMDVEAFAGHVNTFALEFSGVDGAQLITIAPQDAASLMDAIFVYWVTEVRPELLPDLLDPDAPVRLPGEEDPQILPPDVLLASISVTIPAEEALTTESFVIDNNRPYLLHTQLIQELFRIPGLGGGASEAIPAQPTREFATILSMTTPETRTNLRMWIHVGEDIDPDALLAGLQIFRIQPNGVQDSLSIAITEDTNRANDVGRYYDISASTNLQDGDYLLFVFDIDTVQIGGGSMRDFIDGLPFAFSNYAANDGQLFAYHIVHVPPVPAEGTTEIIRETIAPTVPFVTITPTVIGNEVVESFEFWFHLDGIVHINEGSIETIGRETIFAYVEDGPNSTIEVPLVEFDPVEGRRNIFRGIPEQNDLTRPWIRIAFVLEGELVFEAFDPNTQNLERFGNIAEYMNNTGLTPEGQIMEAERGRVLVRYIRAEIAVG